MDSYVWPSRSSDLTLRIFSGNAYCNEPSLYQETRKYSGFEGMHDTKIEYRDSRSDSIQFVKYQTLSDFISFSQK